MCVNKVAPEYDGIELGIGETIIIKAIADSTGRTMDQVKADYKSKGDLGLVAEVKFNIAKFLLVTALFTDISFNATDDVQTQTVNSIACLQKIKRNCSTDRKQKSTT